MPGKSYGLRSLVGYCPWGRRESTQLSNFTFTFILGLADTHYCIYKTNNNNLLYSTGNYTQYLLVTYNGKESKKRIHAHIHTHIYGIAELFCYTPGTLKINYTSIKKKKKASSAWSYGAVETMVRNLDFYTKGNP